MAFWMKTHSQFMTNSQKPMYSLFQKIKYPNLYLMKSIKYQSNQLLVLKSQVMNSAHVKVNELKPKMKLIQNARLNHKTCWHWHRIANGLRFDQFMQVFFFSLCNSWFFWYSYTGLPLAWVFTTQRLTEI